MATAVAPVAEVSTALGAGGGAGAGAGASDGSERQWRLNVKGEWTIANVKPAGSDADKDDSDSAGDVIHVYDQTAPIHCFLWTCIVPYKSY